MTVNPVRQMKKLEKDLRRWCADPTTDRREHCFKTLHKQLASDHPRAAAVAALQLEFLAHWYANHGSLAILEGRVEGWADIDRALHYRWWDIRIDKDTTQVGDVALLLAHALAFEEDSMAEWVAEMFIRSLDTAAPYVWSGVRFGAFLLKLWTMHRGLPDIKVTRPDVTTLGAYQRVLDAWLNPVELRTALSEACDHHLSQSWSGNWVEFGHSPYEMLPVDILAIARVRRDLGLEMPTVEHPLLSTPLATPPPGEQRPRMPQPDPLLEQVIAKAKETGFL